MKIHILYEFVDGPFGGANNFLKNLKEEFENKKIYTENPDKADIVLFNSHICGKKNIINELEKIKKTNKEVRFIHRIDGPVGLYQGSGKTVDKLVYSLNEAFADGTIFQSEWSKRKNEENGFKHTKPSTIIHNGVNKKIFFNKKIKKPHKKVKIVITSWSSNKKKGFDCYKWLDRNLKGVDITFIGNTKVKFENINIIKPLDSKKLSEEIRQNDIYLTASLNETCSNALLEALSCGLPSIAINSGGHSEIVKGGGLLFNRFDEIPDLIKKISKNYCFYSNQIRIKDSEETSKEYIRFFSKVLEKESKRKKFSPIIKAKINLLFWKIKVFIHERS